MIKEYLIANDIYKLMKDASVYGNVVIRDRDKLAAVCLVDWLVDDFSDFIDDKQLLSLKSLINYLSRTGRYTNNLHNQITE